MAARLVALLPMRHASVRVPGKNYRSFAGRPLYHHIVRALLSCPQIDRIVIDTDSEFLRADAAEHFPQLTVLERPVHLRADTTPMNDVLLNAIGQVEAEFYLQTHSTNPLVRPETIQRAVAAFLDAYPIHDSLFSVTRLQTRLWDQLTRPINHHPAILLRTQDLPPTYEENSCLYVFTGDILRQRHNRIGERPLLFEIGRLEAMDVDEELDFKVAEYLYRERAGEPA